MMSTARLLGVFVELADTLVDEFDLVPFLQSLSTHAAAIGDARTAGIVLVDGKGHLGFMAATSEDARSMELFQLQVSEGPCQDCFRTGRAVVAADLSTEGTRWPTFAPIAVDQGVLSVHAFPMRLRDDVIGALNVFRTRVGALGDGEQQVIQSLADIATIGILQERAVSAAELLTVQLQGAMNSRVVIEQAKGVIAQSLTVGVEEGFGRLRAYARSHHMRLVDAAESVVSGRIDPRELA